MRESLFRYLALILSIETSGPVCSVSLHDNGTLIQLKETTENHKHAEMLAPFIQDILRDRKLKVSDLSAIAVSEGPGSYTGLRIGISLAKGMCYASGIPLIAINTLRSLAHACKEHLGEINPMDLFVPMIDARRMEVYTATYDSALREIKKTEPVILNEEYYNSFSGNHRFVIAGNGAAKFEMHKCNANLIYLNEINFSSISIGDLAYEKYKLSEFEDTAYFEPVYLKEFALPTKKNT